MLFKELLFKDPMSYYTRRRRRALKRLLFFVLFFINPICGLISGAAMMLYIHHAVPDGYKVSLYPSRPGFFKSSWTLKVQRVLEEDDQQIHDPADFKPITYPLTLKHGPWVSSNDSSTPWTQKIVFGAFEPKEKGDPRLQQLSGTMNWLGTIAMNIKINDDGLLVVSGYHNVFTGKNIFSLQGSYHQDKEFVDSLSFKNVNISLKTKYSFLGLWLPTTVIDIDKLSYAPAHLFAEDVSVNMYTTRQGHHSSLLIESKAKNFMREHVRYQDLELNCVVLSANSQLLNTYLIDQKKQLIAESLLDRGISIQFSDFVAILPSLKPKSFSASMKGTLHQPFHFNYSKVYEEKEPHSLLEGCGEDIVLLINEFGIEIDPEIILDLKPHQYYTLYWTPDHGWKHIDPANLPVIDEHPEG